MRCSHERESAPLSCRHFCTVGFFQMGKSQICLVSACSAAQGVRVTARPTIFVCSSEGDDAYAYAISMSTVDLIDAIRCSKFSSGEESEWYGSVGDGLLAHSTTALGAAQAYQPLRSSHSAATDFTWSRFEHRIQIIPEELGKVHSRAILR